MHMCLQGSMYSSEPPLARYVLQTSTGKWRRQTSLAASRSKPDAITIHNSLDYTLWKTMYASTAPTRDREKKHESSAVSIMRQMEEFEFRHCPVSPRSMLVGSDPELNPILGLFCGVPLYEIYRALIHVKECHPLQPKPEVPLRLSLDELYTACAHLVPRMVSREYLQKMIFLFSSSDNSGDNDDFYTGHNVLLSGLFSYLVQHAFHPTLNRNVLALFKAFDPELTGVISVSTLTHDVIAAWAELNLFGTLRQNWEKMAAAFQLAGSLDLRVVDGARLLTPQTTCAVFCTSSVLYNTVESLDMEGV